MIPTTRFGERIEEIKTLHGQYLFVNTATDYPNMENMFIEIGISKWSDSEKGHQIVRHLLTIKEAAELAEDILKRTVEATKAAK